MIAQFSDDCPVHLTVDNHQRNDYLLHGVTLQIQDINLECIGSHILEH